MNKHHKQESLHRYFSWALSISLHGLLLLGAYYWHFHPMAALQASGGYGIQLQAAGTRQDLGERVPEVLPSHPAPVTEQPVEQPRVTNAHKKAKITPPDQASKDVALPANSKDQEIPTQETKTAQEGIVSQQGSQPGIDQRGLYGSGTNSSKQAGAGLELEGWIWDSVPQAQDTTSETGKLIFEVTIDDLGEIIAVKTLEKTVSPLVEQIYKDAVAKLTFSKTTEKRNYQPTSVGKVTFIIQAK